MQRSGLDILSSSRGLCSSPVNISNGRLASLLRECENQHDLASGQKVYHTILCYGSESTAFVGSYLIRMFAQCGCLHEANHTFNGISEPNVFSWSAIICANANLGQEKQAIKLFHLMQNTNVKPDAYVLVAVFKACLSLGAIIHGKLIHHFIVESGFDLDGSVGSTLIDFYSKCGSLNDARNLFHKLQQTPDIVTWSVLVAGYAQQGYSEEALGIYKEMLKCGMEPDRVIFLCALKACCSTTTVAQLKLIHDHITNVGLEKNTIVANALIDTYAKCGSLEDADGVFNCLRKRDMVTWGAMIEGCTHHGHGQDALQLFSRMQSEGLQPDRVVSISTLKACSIVDALDQGKLIHSHAIEVGFELDPVVVSSLIDMYAKCGCLADAQKVFECSKCQNLIIWNTLLTGCIQHEQKEEAMELFQQMIQQHIEPSEVTFVCILKVCTECSKLQVVHAYIIESGLETNALVGNTIIDMYAKCQSLVDAVNLFDKMSKHDSVTWGVIISGLVQYNHFEKAFHLLLQMLQEGVQPDEATFLSILKACSNIEDLEMGNLIHAEILECSFEFDNSIGNTLIDLYNKCQNLEDAWSVFEALPKRDLVTYNAMIAASTFLGDIQKCYQLFNQMQQETAGPNEITYVSILGACAKIAALDEGKIIHGHIIESNFSGDLYVVNSLIDMYAKCGTLESACSVFDRCGKRDIVTWNTIIAGCAQLSNSELAFEYFEMMTRAGLKPDEVTLTSLLSACSHAGLLDRANSLFKCMEVDYGITPTVDHCNCMADLLGRTGSLEDAEDLLVSAPFVANIVGLTSLLSHCKINGNVWLGHDCFDHFIEMDISNAAGYVLMSHAYSYLGLQEDACEIEEMRKGYSAWKKPGKALIQVGNRVHDFIVGDQNSLTPGELDAKLKRLNFSMKEKGYMPSLTLMLQTLKGNDEIA